MRAVRALMLAALLCGCASASMRAPAPIGEVTGITVWVTSWGRTLEKWTIHADGTATLEQRPREMSLLEPLTPQSFTISPQDFARVQAALNGAERYAGASLPCSSSNVVTDAP